MTGSMGDYAEPKTDRGHAGAAAVGAAKRRLVASLLKKFVADDLLPVLLDLRLVLQSAQLPQGRALTQALFGLLREHKSEVRALAWNVGTRLRAMQWVFCN